MIFPQSWFPFSSGSNRPARHAIRDSLWQFAAIEAVHLLALAMIGGAVLIVDLRLLGWTLDVSRCGRSRATLSRGWSPA